MKFDLADAGIPGPPRRGVLGPEPGLDERAPFTVEAEAEFHEIMDDLERCDGYAPCGDCDRCTKEGRPWREARAAWLEQELHEGREVRK